MKEHLVVLKNDDMKIVYEIAEEQGEMLLIKGVNYRIVRTVNKDEVEKATEDNVNKEKEHSKKYYQKLTTNTIRSGKKYMLGTILHIDGDENYLKKCMELYDALDIFAYGVKIEESQMEIKINELLSQITPDIIVITGHDSYNSLGLGNLENYKNTHHFMETIKAIRKHDTNCCIIAGACQSHFEALMASGATFASSPKRINIHTFDPAVIAIKVSTTSFMKTVDFNSILKYIDGGRKAFGGVETLGKMRMLL